MNVEDYIHMDPHVRYMRQFKTVEEAYDRGTKAQKLRILEQCPEIVPFDRLTRLAGKLGIVSGDAKEIVEKIKNVCTESELTEIRSRKRKS